MGVEVWGEGFGARVLGWGVFGVREFGVGDLGRDFGVGVWGEGSGVGFWGGGFLG